MRRLTPTAVPSWLRTKSSAFGHGNYSTVFGASGTGNASYDSPMECAYGVWYHDGTGGGKPQNGWGLDYFQTLLLVVA